MANEKKVLYLMHVPWGWIKQRPHFLAENLAQKLRVTVYFDKQYGTAYNKTGKINETLCIKSFFSLPPLFKKVFPLSLVNYYIKKATCILRVKLNDIVWVTSPNQFAHIKDFLPASKIVVYDNMDDLLAMYHFNPKLSELELNLCKRANLIICSAENLKGKIVARHGITDKKIRVINNGINKIPQPGPNNLGNEILERFNNSAVKLLYVGTVSDWFNFELVAQMLDKNPNILLYLIGPIDIKPFLHPQIQYIPPVDHAKVFDIMQFADALIMPFKLNELILGVNPVKAYEYIATGKPVILVGYPETEKFKEFAYLYYSNDEFFELGKQLGNGTLKPLADNETCRKFALQNTWEIRSKIIIEKINELSMNPMIANRNEQIMDIPSNHK